MNRSTSIPMPPVCPRHPHFTAGCEGCRHYSRTCAKRIKILASRGEHVRPVIIDAGQVRDHINALHATGMSYNQIARGARVSSNYIRDLAVGNRSRCSETTAGQILAVAAQPALRAGQVLAVGTSRRLRALAALGYPITEQAEWYGMSNVYLSRVARGAQDRVTESTAHLVRQAYQRLSMRPAPTSPRSRAVRSYASRAGWLPPLVWDDETIDDPNAEPNLGAGADDEPDDEVVARIRAGQKVPARPADRLEVCRRILADGRGISEICRRLNVSGATAKKLAYQAVTGPDDRLEPAA